MGTTKGVEPAGSAKRDRAAIEAEWGSQLRNAVRNRQYQAVLRHATKGTLAVNGDSLYWNDPSRGSFVLFDGDELLLEGRYKNSRKVKREEYSYVESILTRSRERVRSTVSVTRTAEDTFDIRLQIDIAGEEPDIYRIILDGPSGGLSPINISATAARVKDQYPFEVLGAFVDVPEPWVAYRLRWDPKYINCAHPDLEQSQRDKCRACSGTTAAAAGVGAFCVVSGNPIVCGIAWSKAVDAAQCWLEYRGMFD